jgi:hypothetical protein
VGEEYSLMGENLENDGANSLCLNQDYQRGRSAHSVVLYQVSVILISQDLRIFRIASWDVMAFHAWFQGRRLGWRYFN